MMPNHPIRRALSIAALYLLTALVLDALRQRHVVGADTVMRLMGMLVGLAVLVNANALPKRLVPLARLSCAPAREQYLRRFAAWALALGALGYTSAYAFAPIASAGMLAVCALAPAVIAVAGISARCAWMRRAA